MKSMGCKDVNVRGNPDKLLIARGEFLIKPERAHLF